MSGKKPCRGLDARGEGRRNPSLLSSFDAVRELLRCPLLGQDEFAVRRGGKSTGENKYRGQDMKPVRSLGDTVFRPISSPSLGRLSSKNKNDHGRGHLGERSSAGNKTKEQSRGCERMIEPTSMTKTLEADDAAA